MLGYYEGNYANAIASIFPEIGIIKAKFISIPSMPVPSPLSPLLSLPLLSYPPFLFLSPFLPFRSLGHRLHFFEIGIIKQNLSLFLVCHHLPSYISPFPPFSLTLVILFIPPLLFSSFPLSLSPPFPLPWPSPLYFPKSES